MPMPKINCPTCDGLMSHKSHRCAWCRQRLEAARIATTPTAPTARVRTRPAKPRTFDHEAAHALRSTGQTYRQIGAHFGVSQQAIQSACQRIDGTKSTGRRAPRIIPGRVSIFTPWPGKVNTNANAPAPQQRQSVWSRWFEGDE